MHCEVIGRCIYLNDIITTFRVQYLKDHNRTIENKISQIENSISGGGALVVYVFVFLATPV